MRILAMVCGLGLLALPIAARAQSAVAAASDAPARATPVDTQYLTLPTRGGSAGKAVTMDMVVLTSSGQPVRHVLLYVSAFGMPQLSLRADGTRGLPTQPWLRTALGLVPRGVVFATADVPSDANQRSLAQRPLPEITADITAAVKHLQARYPGVPVHLAGFGQDAGELVAASMRLPGVGRLVFASADFRSYRTQDWTRLRHPVLVVQAPGGQCDALSYTDTAYVAQRNGFSLVAAGYPRPERESQCGLGSQRALAGLEDALAQLISNWLDGAAPPPSIGFANPTVAWREQVTRYQVPESLGAEWRELSLLYPDGEGPFPVVVFNHGDVPPDTPWIRYRQRMVEMVVAREFLKLGWAVAFPARRGVGLSDGIYGNEEVRDDFNPTYKAQVHAKEILPVLDTLAQMPLLDTRRVVLSGQSAGGYAVMQLATLGLPGVVGLVNFSGGRTDRRAAGTFSPDHINEIMVNGFAEFGKATTIPSLWVFAENDSRYPAATIRASFKAFTQAGGRATLFLNPPLPGDGHFIYNEPQLWRGALAAYLRNLEPRR